MAAKTVTMIYVEWFDASIDDGPFNIDDFIRDNPEPLLMRTCGILAKENKNGLYIALDYNESTNKYRPIQHIPKAYVRFVQKVVINNHTPKLIKSQRKKK